MKYREKRFTPQETEKESEYGIHVYDGKGNEYHIDTNNLGEIEITLNDGGNLLVNPRYANQIIIKADNHYEQK